MRDIKCDGFKRDPDIKGTEYKKNMKPTYDVIEIIKDMGWLWDTESKVAALVDLKQR